MKKKKIIIIILVVIVLIAIIMMIIPMFHSARSASPDFYPKETNDAIELELKYICPMDCEPGKKYSKNGDCDVCEMPLTVLKTKDIFDTILVEENINEDNKEKSSDSDKK